MKRYIKPVSEVIQTEATCNSFVQATVMSGRDSSTVVNTIPVYEDRVPGNPYKAWDDDNLGEDTWGGD